MRNADRYKLLHGPYLAPHLRRGDRATCFFRDGTVIFFPRKHERIRDNLAEQGRLRSLPRNPSLLNPLSCRSFTKA